MKNTIIGIGLLLAISIQFIRCHSHSSAAHSHDPADIIHEEYLEKELNQTIWTDSLEIFLAHKAFIEDQENTLIFHITDLKDNSAVKSDEIDFTLFNLNKPIASYTSNNDDSPGIFKITLTAHQEAYTDLQLKLNYNNYSDTVRLSDIIVYSSEKEALDSLQGTEDSGHIAFLKEQSWMTNFETQLVERRSINKVIHTSGELQPVRSEESIIAAKTSGIIRFKSNQMHEGIDVRKAEVLFEINSKDLLDSNLDRRFEIAKAQFDKTKANFERAEKLLEQSIIADKEYEQRKMDFSIAESEFNTIKKSYNPNGKLIRSPISGIIKNVLVADGQFVSEGTSLIELTRNRRLILRADVSQADLSSLRSLKSANFKTSYSDEVYSLEDYNGSLVAYGKVLEAGSSFVPVLFELDNLTELIPGSYVELFLLMEPIENQICIPKSALLKDYNMSYVYVQTSGEKFEKREVSLGIDDGINVQILSGISENERFVTKGAYHIKMASMSSSIPSHGHSH